jgi:hypothetical protein
VHDDGIYAHHITNRRGTDILIAENMSGSWAMGIRLLHNSVGPRWLLLTSSNNTLLQGGSDNDVIRARYRPLAADVHGT